MMSDSVPRDEHEALKAEYRRLVESNRNLEELLDKISDRLDAEFKEMEGISRELQFVENDRFEKVADLQNAGFQAEQVMQEWQRTERELSKLQVDHNQLVKDYRKLQSANNTLIEMVQGLRKAYTK